MIIVIETCPLLSCYQFVPVHNQTYTDRVVTKLGIRPLDRNTNQ